MGNSSSTSFKNYTVKIETTNGKTFEISSHSFIEHILLLRKVIRHSEMTTEGPILNNYINEYRKRMTHGEMKTADQQSKLPWQIDWIWHVHRLHSLNYINDCKEQLPDGLVEKRRLNIPVNHGEKLESDMTFQSNKNDSTLFYLSIDLSSAVIRQNDFLNKFRKHVFYSNDLKQLSEWTFRKLIDDYVSFIKLATKDMLIVPTFDIDLIWHTYEISIRIS